MRVRLLAYRDTYCLGAIFLFDPDPVNGKWIAMAHTGHHTFVLLISVLRVLHGYNMRKNYSRETAHLN